ncbi:hypothetical protein AOQ84DRAFT_376778 [Glonium stellatum]|uniref:Uncharacterized protein n=1 Tax=Glonium stellatum TaxID=574774 RepID=A0A8E2F0Q2_9PEZI|nr:hypothetical protein AOQ84DRAFT_376778 [Glonium stellatum]
MLLLALPFLGYLISPVLSGAVYSASNRHIQEPLVSSKEEPNLLPIPTLPSVKEKAVTVGLYITASGSHEEIYVEIPLHERVSPNALLGLPRHPQSARLADLLESGAQVSNRRRIERTICLIHPVISPEERSMRSHLYRTGSDNGDWSPWFMLDDGIVNFEHPANRWFLAGREVESYECF